MDIVTHGLMGLALASPLLPEHPFAATGLALGSTLPDLDAFSRLGGKRAFMASHQTVTHSYPVIAALAVGVELALRLAGIEAPGLALGLAAGMCLHVTLDLTNTYGITPFAPFSWRRVCLEWVFFIDAIVLGASVAAVACVLAGDDDPRWIATYAGGLLGYWGLRGALRRRAGRLAPAGTLSLLPSAWVPWRYYGCRRVPEGVQTFRLSGWSGRCDHETVWPVFDEDVDAVWTLPEAQVMRSLSPAYHAVAHDADRVRCEDLRTRNFDTSFGALDVTLGADGQVVAKVFHV